MKTCFGFAIWNARHHAHITFRPTLSNEPMFKKDKPIIHMCDVGFVHIERQLQFPFQKISTFIPNGFRLLLCAFDD
jgi:hypothetical protein